MELPRLVIFASGSATGGGSGFEKLVEASRRDVLRAKIVAVISNHGNGGVRERADRLGVPFVHFAAPWTADRYRELIRELAPDFIALSGWLKLAAGLDPRITFNIHPGPLPDFGGPGMYGHHVHEAIMQAYRAGKITHSAVSMHFVTEEYDRGPVFFRLPVEILPTDTPDDIGARVNKAEHEWQARITDHVVNGRIGWDGKDPRSLRVPDGYQFLP